MKISRNTTTERRCTICGGAGTVTRNDSNPFGYGPDPQQDYDVPCPNVDCVDGWIRWAEVDLLEQLDYVRPNKKRFQSSSVRYEKVRRTAMLPVHLP